MLTKERLQAIKDDVIDKGRSLNGSMGEWNRAVNLVYDRLAAEWNEPFGETTTIPSVKFRQMAQAYEELDRLKEKLSIDPRNYVAVPTEEYNQMQHKVSMLNGYNDRYDALNEEKSKLEQKLADLEKKKTNRVTYVGPDELVFECNAAVQAAGDDVDGDAFDDAENSDWTCDWSDWRAHVPKSIGDRWASLPHSVRLLIWTIAKSATDEDNPEELKTAYNESRLYASKLTALLLSRWEAGGWMLTAPVDFDEHVKNNKGYHTDHSHKNNQFYFKERGDALKCLHDAMDAKAKTLIGNGMSSLFNKIISALKEGRVEEFVKNSPNVFEDKTNGEPKRRASKADFDAAMMNKTNECSQGNGDIAVENNIGGFVLYYPNGADPEDVAIIAEGLEHHHDHPACMAALRYNLAELNKELGREAWRVVPLAVQPA